MSSCASSDIEQLGLTANGVGQFEAVVLIPQAGLDLRAASVSGACSLTAHRWLATRMASGQTLKSSMQLGMRTMGNEFFCTAWTFLAKIENSGNLMNLHKMFEEANRYGRAVGPINKLSCNDIAQFELV